MPAWPANLDGWELGPPLHAWQGFRMHPAARTGALPAPATCWLHEEPVGEDVRDAWLHRIEVAKGWVHPGLPKIHAGGVWSGRVWAITEPVPRGTLLPFRVPKLLTEPERAALVQQVLSALVFAHQNGFVHGALSAEALAGSRGRWRIAGLGLVDITVENRRTWVEGDTPSPSTDLLDLAKLLATFRGTAEAPPEDVRRLRALLMTPGATAAGVLAASGLAAPEGVHRPGGVPPPVSAPQPRIGRYVLIEPLAHGGMGVVWRAHDPDLGRDVAVKVHRPTAVLPEQALARFRQEARAAGRLDHPAIVRILDFGSAPEGLYYAMELVEGTDLAQRLRDVGRIDPLHAARWTASLARGLAHAHLEGIVHRDLKPANIMLEGDDQPRITDFGIALAIDEDNERLTHDGAVVGTPLYMAPEQAAGRTDLMGPRSDIYSLGAVLYEMLTGRPPFPDRSMADVVHDVVHTSPAPLRSGAPDVPADLVHVVQKAMELNPADRYASMDALATDLESFLVGEPVSARAPSLWSRARTWIRRHKNTSLATAGALGALLLFGGGWAAFAAQAAEATHQREAEAARRVAEATSAMEALTAKGDNAAARRLFAELVTRPDLQGTPAWTDAWLAEAARRAAVGDGAGERDALGRVWLGAERAGTRRLALTRVAGSWRRELRLDQVGLVLDALRQDGGAERASPAERALDAEAALYRWQTAGVIHAAAPMVAALATRTPTDLAATDPWLEPIRGVVGAPAVVREHDGSRAWLLTPDGRTEPLPSPPEQARFVAFYRLGGEATLHAVACTASALILLAQGDGWVEEGRLALPAVIDVEVTWLDGAAPTLVVSSGRGRTVSLVRQGADGGWSVQPSLWPSAALNSDFGGATALDADGDGSRELVVAMGAWQAYDLRLLQAVGSHFQLRARARLGDLHTPRPIHLRAGGNAVAVGSTARYRSGSIFRDRAPVEGVVVMRLADENLAEVFRFEAPGGCVVQGTGPVDDDDLDDVVARCGDVPVLLRQGARGFSGAVVADLELRGAADVDGDGDLEVLAREPGASGPRFVLAGLAGAPRAPLPAPTLTVDTPSRITTAAKTEQRRREEVVAALGLSWTSGALQAPAPGSAPEQALRIAALEAGRGRFEEAVRAATVALAGGSGAEGELTATEAVKRAIEPEGARALLGVRPAIADPGVSALARLERLDLDMQQQLDPRWRIGDPGALRWGGSGRPTRVEVVGNREAARLPVVVAGETLRLELGLDLETVEWDGGFTVALIPEGATAAEAPLRIWVRGEGGGGSVTTTTYVQLGADAEIRAKTGRARRVASDHAKVDLACALDARSGSRRVRIDVDGEPALLESTSPLVSPTVPGGRYDLVLAGGSDSSSSGRFVGHLRHLRLDGAAIAMGTPPLGEVSVATHALAGGRPDAALDALGSVTGTAADEARMWALLELGRAGEAAEPYGRLLRATPQEPSPAGPLRTRSRWAVGVLKRVLGPPWLEAAWAAWGPPVHQHPDDPDLAAEFMSWAEDIPEPPAGADRATRLTFAEVSLTLARVARMQERLSLAAELVRRAARCVDADDASVEAAGLRARAAVERASVAMVRGDEPEVRAGLGAALEAHAAPEALAEQLNADPTFAPARTRTWWVPLVEPFRRYGARARGD